MPEQAQGQTDLGMNTGSRLVTCLLLQNRPLPL